MTKEKIKENLRSMSLGDHLEELRARLILIFLGVIIGLAVALFFGSHLVSFLETPYFLAMQKHSESKENKNDESVPADVRVSIRNLVNVRISEQNINALKSLKPGDSFLAYIESYQDDPNNPAFSELKEMQASEEARPVKQLQTIELSEGFLIYLKVCFVVGIIIVSPWVFWQIWAFISAGLYCHEKKFVKMVAPISAALFILGSVFFMAVVAPLVMSFFIRFNNAMGVASNWTLKSYMTFVLRLTLVFGAAFQMPIAIVFAELMGLVSIQALTANRKYVILGLLFIAAVATPPDIISQVLLAAPLYVLYESSILVCRFLKKKKQSNSS